jgi:hypothetical protein
MPVEVNQLSTSVLPKPFSTATQFLERQSIATHVALLDKQKVVLKIKKKYFYLLLNIILQKTRPISHNEACVIGALDDGIDIHVNASYFQAQGVRQFQLVSKFGVHSYHCRKPNFTDVRR